MGCSQPQPEPDAVAGAVDVRLDWTTVDSAARRAVAEHLESRGALRLTQAETEVADRDRCVSGSAVAGVAAHAAARRFALATAHFAALEALGFPLPAALRARIVRVQRALLKGSLSSCD